MVVMMQRPTDFLLVTPDRASIPQRSPIGPKRNPPPVPASCPFLSFLLRRPRAHVAPSARVHSPQAVEVDRDVPAPVPLHLSIPRTIQRQNLHPSRIPASHPVPVPSLDFEAVEVVLRDENTRRFWSRG